MGDTGARAQLDYLWAAAVAENDWAFHNSTSKAGVRCAASEAEGRHRGACQADERKLEHDRLHTLHRRLDVSEKPRTCVCHRTQRHGSRDRGYCGLQNIQEDGRVPRRAHQQLDRDGGPQKRCETVVMDNASNNKRASDLLRADYPSIFFTNCVAHTLDLMLHDMGNIRAMKRVLSQVHRVVMMVKGSASAVTLFEDLFSKLSLVRPGATRFGTQVIMLSRFLEVKQALRSMVISEEWEGIAVAQKEEGKAVRKLLLDDVFWECGTAVLRLMTPVYEVLRTVDTRALVMGQVYGLMLEATVKTNEAAEAAGERHISH
ncbi:unnamed protein product [Closterium sp. NIES-54]